MAAFTSSVSHFRACLVFETRGTQVVSGHDAHDPLHIGGDVDFEGLLGRSYGCRA